MRLRRRLYSTRRPADPSEVRASLGALDQMRELSSEGHDRLASNAVELTYPAEIDVIAEGRFPSGFFLVQEGRLEILAGDSSGHTIKVNELGPGSHFGEVGLIEGMPATATVRTLEQSRLLQIPGRDLLAVLDLEPNVMAAFLEPISGALARTDPTYVLSADEAAGKPMESEDVAALRRLAADASDLGAMLAPSGSGDLLERIADAALAVLDARACSIALVEGDHLVFRAVVGEGASRLRGKRLDISRGITGAVFATGEAVAVDDVSSDPRFDDALASDTGYVPRSLHATRLETERGPLGVLQVLDAGRLAGTEGASPALTAFADLAAMIIETDALFTNLGRALFSAAASVLEGQPVAETLGGVARTTPEGSRPYARMMAALDSLRDLDDEGAEALLRALKAGGH